MISLIRKFWFEWVYLTIQTDPMKLKLIVIILLNALISFILMHKEYQIEGFQYLLIDNLYILYSKIYSLTLTIQDF